MFKSLNLTTDEQRFVDKATDIAFSALTALDMLCKQLAEGAVPSRPELLNLADVTTKALAMNRELKDELERLYVAGGRDRRKTN